MVMCRGCVPGFLDIFGFNKLPRPGFWKLRRHYLQREDAKVGGVRYRQCRGIITQTLVLSKAISLDAGLA